MTTIIAIANQKGGVGKTTTAVNLAHGLTLKGKQVLLVDFDPQGQCATTLGLEPEDGAASLLMMGTEENDDTYVKQFVRNTGRDRFWLLAGSKRIQMAQILIGSQGSPLDYLHSRLRRFLGGPDYIILDTAPSVGGVQEQALWASDFVIIPTSAEYLGTDGVSKIMDTLLKLKKEGNWDGSLLGILPTMVRDRLLEHKASLEDLKGGFGDQILDPIHRAAVISQCPGEARTIFEKDPTSRAAAEYAALVEEVLRY